MKPVWRIWLRARLTAASLIQDCRGIAATEFAVIVPIMLVMFFGTVEFSSGIAAPPANGSSVTIPTTLAVGGTYLLFSEVSYLYVPAIGYVMAKPESRCTT
jgi:hypothetical protein